jgi:hypothetical protein
MLMISSRNSLKKPSKILKIAFMISDKITPRYLKRSMKNFDRKPPVLVRNFGKIIIATVRSVNISMVREYSIV